MKMDLAPAIVALNEAVREINARKHLTLRDITAVFGADEVYPLLLAEFGGRGYHCCCCCHKEAR